jgi:hypothetical protein
VFGQGSSWNVVDDLLVMNSRHDQSRGRVQVPQCR